MFPWTRNNAIAIDARKLSKEKFIEIHEMPEEQEPIYNIIRKANVGYITIKQVRGNKPGFEMEGVTATFAEGISLFIDNETQYYYTSVVEKINWEEGYFDTMNSRYEFTFNAIPENEL